ncbi:indolepyruvate ferredoxin oxidoreductase, partial [Candidatus Thorarchaeota archaeon]
MKNNKNEFLMSGNEALARGALESGVGFCASYPGTPSTEITETLIRTGIAHVEWSTNEKVALEACAGASWAGIRALCPMKSLGLNVASDFLLNLNLTGTGLGGLVIVVCDDPMGHSSSNEQDSRFYAKAAKVPLLEPSTYQEAKDVIPFAFQISTDFEVPVIVRSTTRLSHSRGMVRIEAPTSPKTTAKALPAGLFNVPRPTKKHRDLLAKLERVSDLYNESSWNEIEEDDAASTLVISSGVSSRYVEEAICVLDSNEFAVLRIVTSYPLPYKTIMNAITRYDRVVFVEENDPFIEDEVRALSTTLGRTPKMFGVRTGQTAPGGEMTTDRARDILTAAVGLEEIARERPSPDPGLLSERPLTFCAGCTHRNFYYA